MGAVQGVGEQLAEATIRPQDAVEALAAQDRSVTHQALQAGQAQVPTQLGRMTPSTLLSVVVDEARKLEIAEAMKELHVELEPEDLGPLVVRLRKGPDGTLDIGFRTREGEAARVLEQGAEELRDRLAAAGFAAVKIDVARTPSCACADRRVPDRHLGRVTREKDTRVPIWRNSIGKARPARVELREKDT